MKKLYEKCNKDKKESSDKHVTDIDDAVEKHIEALEDAAGEGIQSINDVTEHQVNEIYVAANKGKQIVYQPKMTKVNTATYTDQYSGQTTDVKIVDIHDSDPDDIHYTVEFQNGRQKKISAPELVKQNEVQILKVKPSKPFPIVDPSKIADPRRSHNPYVTPPRSSSLDTPTAWDIKNFHSQLKSQLRSDDDILVFYNQLRSQDRTYNIHLIDIQHITPDCDLCPTGIPATARETTALAIYQKLQDENTRDFTYDELQNCLDQNAVTSDGYDVLQELLRRAHPKLYEVKYEINMSKLSQCDHNLFKYNKRTQQYFSAEAIKNRHYTEKEKASHYLQNIDDSRYESVVQKCVVDLSIATMASDVIRKKSLTFSGLPQTIEQLSTITTKDRPIIRSVTAQERSTFRKNLSRGAYRKYEQFQCLGCGLWGHKIGTCSKVPETAAYIDYISKNKSKTKAILEEHLRVNSKNAKKNTIRLLMSNGIVDEGKSVEEHLKEGDLEEEHNHFQVDLEEIEEE